MRLHVYDYNPYQSDMTIYLDGEPVKRCFFADEEAGMVEFYVTDNDGNIAFTKLGDETEPQQERKFGHVHIALHANEEQSQRRRDDLQRMHQQRDAAHRVGKTYADLRTMYNDHHGEDLINKINSVMRKVAKDMGKTYGSGSVTTSTDWSTHWVVTPNFHNIASQSSGWFVNSNRVLPSADEVLSRYSHISVKGD